MQGPDGRLIVIGYGNMGKALVQGVVSADVGRGIGALYAPERVVAVDPSGGDEAAPVRVEASLGRIGPLTERDEVVLAVKPQVYPQVTATLAAVLPSASALVVSVMAGVTTARMSGDLGARARVVRAMPNTPAQVRQGTTAFAFGPGATGDDGARVQKLLGTLGPLVLRIDESLMDAFTAVAGSGPAYLFQLAEGMMEGAMAAGFDAATADAVVRQTLLGAATLLSREPASAAELRVRVTSKGGTTEAALNVLEQRGVRAAVRDAIVAARDRGRELGG